MHPATRQQKDYPFDAESLESGIRFNDANDPEQKSLTRQEQGPDTDVNRILAAYGVPFGRPAQFGEVDFTLDLQRLYEVRDIYTDVLQKLPQSVRDQFPDAAAIMRGVADGTLRASIEDASARALNTNPPPTPPTP